MNRAELGRVLRLARDRVDPPDAGLPRSAVRRVPGLRREEVATLAGVSVDYVVRLEQGRGPHPSPAVLGALARALRLTDAERAQVFELADVKLPRDGQVEMLVRGSLLRLLDRFVDLPAQVLSAKGDVLAWNAMAAALLGDWSRFPARERNVIWQRFLGPGSRVRQSPDEAEATARRSVAQLRSALARYPDDRDLARLVAELRAGSEWFAQLWREAPALTHTGRTKVVEHPDVGILTLDCESLAVPDSGQTLTVYSAAPGTEDAAKLELLGVLGTQTMADGR